MIGKIVYSKCGHDKGKIFVVVAKDSSHYYLVDGKQRLISRPKKKKFKHVQPTNYICEELVDKILSGQCLDADFVKNIKKFEERD